MPQAWGFNLRGEGETLELDIYDVVGGPWYSSITARAVRDRLRARQDAKLIKIRINSQGGDVFDGFAIYNLLNAHPARVEVDIDGLAASVASVIAMAADEIRIASNAWMMIHEAQGAEEGRAEDLRRWADVIEKMNGQAADIYAARTGLQANAVRALMKATTWMTAAEAKAKGFVDTIAASKPRPSGAATARATAWACMAVDDYDNMPAEVRDLIAQAKRDSAIDDDATRARQLNPEPGGPEYRQDPGTGKEREPAMALHKMVAKLLGLSEAASDDAIGDATAQLQGELARGRDASAALEKLTGKTGEQAIGVLQAWKQSHEELPAATASLSELRSKSESAELDAVLAKAKSEHRHTPAREAKLRELVGSKDVTHRGALTMVEQWQAVGALVAGANAETAQSSAGTGSLKHNDKTYADMNSGERSKLKKENPDLFEAMRKQAKDNGEA